MNDGSAGPTGGWVWTTFSRPPNADGSAATRQVDLNFRNPRVLLEMLEVLLCYRGHGADWVRLDAAGYMWKAARHAEHPSSQHPPDVAGAAGRTGRPRGPGDRGRGERAAGHGAAVPGEHWTQGVECDLAYQFAHFPLAVHALLSGDAAPLPALARETLDPFAGRQFVTVYGSHDGMGRKPVHRAAAGRRPRADGAGCLVAHHGALPNYARQAGGERIIYELCATPWSLINRAARG